MKVATIVIAITVSIHLSSSAPTDGGANVIGITGIDHIKQSPTEEDVDQFFKDQAHLAAFKNNATNQATGSSSSSLVSSLPDGFNQVWVIIGQLTSFEEWLGFLSQLDLSMIHGGSS